MTHLNSIPINLGVAGFLCILLAACSTSKPTSSKPDSAPNILFLFADDQRFNTIAALGNEEIITPTLDALVRTGTAFTNAYIMGAMNGAVCAPSRAMLMTGRGVFDVNPPPANHLDMPDTLFPRALASNGYQTFETGKWHNGKVAFQQAFDAGSRIFFGGMFDQYSVPTYEYRQDGAYPDSLKTVRDLHSSELYANAAVAYIEQVDPDRGPFMMYVAFQAPHDPRDVDQKYIDLYDTSSLTLPPNFLPEHPFDNGELDIRDEWLAGYPRTSDEVKANIAAYYAMITHMDEQIGRIVAALEEKGLREETIIVFSADNGLAVGQHGLMGKQNLYEHSIKVPLIFQGPGIPADVQQDALVYLIDIYPTLCQLTHTPIPSLVEGQSLTPILQGKQSEGRSSMIYAYKSNQRAYREGEFKLLTYMVSGKRTTQLFNLNADPWETQDLSEQPEYQDQIADMKKKMQAQLSLEGDKAILAEADWGIEALPRWIHKVSPQTIEWLRGLAERERKLRGF
ncbi:MAG: sulfatase-like hydrolase/transferase [Bacteroidota bacterium]